MKLPPAFACALVIALGPAVSGGAQPARAAPQAAASAPPFLGGIWVNPYGAGKQTAPSNPDHVRPPVPPAQYTPEYAAKHEAIKRVWEQAQLGKGVGPEFVDSIMMKRQVYCLPYGMPRMMLWDTTLDIQQAADRITIVGEIDREIRRIWLDRQQLPLEEVDLGFFGRSVGRWEGSALVVNTIGVKAGVDGEDFMAHSDQMVINERFYLHKPDILYDDITITDPLALKKPLSYRAVWVRAPRDFEPTEFVCENFHHALDANGKIHMDLERP